MHALACSHLRVSVLGGAVQALVRVVGTPAKRRLAFSPPQTRDLADGFAVSHACRRMGQRARESLSCVRIRGERRPDKHHGGCAARAVATVPACPCQAVPGRAFQAAKRRRSSLPGGDVAPGGPVPWAALMTSAWMPTLAARVRASSAAAAAASAASSALRSPSGGLRPPAPPSSQTPSGLSASRGRIASGCSALGCGRAAPAAACARFRFPSRPTAAADFSASAATAGSAVGRPRASPPAPAAPPPSLAAPAALPDGAPARRNSHIKA